ncbi:SCO3374 family protein [Streptomyces sp. HU2014]|uniref:SCO3374 family protein n=1 Tax=Streptomyces TaxID=1883 RepID=UPI001F1D076D|nr:MULTISPECIES: SCO3374 family protein [Streptomyces]UQI48584.1 SCO3374 family protein [Streptomyces sp. HU2014]
MTATLPGPCVPPCPWCQARRWYEHGLRWPTAGPCSQAPLSLLTGVRFDALDLPVDAGFAVLRRVGRTGPVALDGRARRLRFLIAAGSADELPGLLDWLEWGGVALDLTALGAGGRIVAPLPRSAGDRGGRGHLGALGAGRAVWVRPPEPGREVEPTLPVTGLGGEGGAPDLVRLVSAAATECHRARLLRAGEARTRRPTGDQPLAFSYASRMSAGTRPRSLTL